MHGIQIIGDIPIYVAHDSADVWGHPEIFCHDGQNTAAGVPPTTSAPLVSCGATQFITGRNYSKWTFWWVQRFQAMLDT